MKKNVTSIRKCRVAANMTQEEVAAELGMNRSTYARQEASGNVRAENLTKLSKLFGVTLNKLIGYETDTPNECPAVPEWMVKAYQNQLQPQVLNSDPVPQIFKRAVPDNVNILTNNEKNIIKIYRSLSAEQKKKVNSFIQEEAGFRK